MAEGLRGLIENNAVRSGVVIVAGALALNACGDSGSGRAASSPAPGQESRTAGASFGRESCQFAKGNTVHPNDAVWVQAGVTVSKDGTVSRMVYRDGGRELAELKAEGVTAGSFAVANTVKVSDATRYVRGVVSLGNDGCTVDPSDKRPATDAQAVTVTGTVIEGGLTYASFNDGSRTATSPLGAMGAGGISVVFPGGVPEGFQKVEG